ncbi:MAG: hydroxyacid dehydrogenase [Candidatus Pacebacteria bacterium]|nr:hydroxyacid dehydrogenase [Candidatus Paceibacterota bacterium]
MKIIIYEVEDWERPSFEKVAEESEHEVIFVPRPLSAENAAENSDAEIISTFIYSDLDAEVLNKFTNVKLIATRSTGYDHIAIDTCRERGITITNVPSYGDNTVAEHVFGLLLSISHNIPRAIYQTRMGDFSQRNLQGFDLQGKTLGVFGTGNIGEHVIRIAKGFGMEVAAYDVKPRKKLADELGFCYGSMEEVLYGSHVITLHVPATPKTRHLIGEREFKLMRDGVVLINTARGNIVDNEALLHALADGKVAAAGLDVLPEEPAIREEAELVRSVFRKSHNLETLLVNHILLRMRNVIITPHSAFNTREAIQRIINTTIENIQSFLEGTPTNKV